jgi:hypothetical protein
MSEDGEWKMDAPKRCDGPMVVVGRNVEDGERVGRLVRGEHSETENDERVGEVTQVRLWAVWDDQW